MLLAVDIGNTNISFGLFKGNRLVRKFDIPSVGFSLGKLRLRLGKKADISAAIICSVVPRLTPAVSAGINKLLRITPIIIGKDIKVPLKNLYRNPRQVGQDRLVNAYAGVMFYGSPLIAVDSGTAITFDVISRKKEYLGGMILPGLNMSLDALHCKTALLPQMKLRPPKEFIGRDTQGSILSGIIHGIAGLADEMVRKIRLVVGEDAVVIGTGGNIKLIAKYSRSFDAVDSDLTLKGLNLIFRDGSQLKAKVSPKKGHFSFGFRTVPKFILIAIFSLLSYSVCFSQPFEEKPLSESVKKGFEEAIQKLDAEKQKEHKKIAAELQAKLDTAVQDWVNQQKSKRNRELNTIIEQQWENLTEFGPRIHRSYYLRDYSYTIINVDIVKTESMIGAYKAVMNVTEKLFAERYHSPDVTYPQDFYYTVTTPVRVNFEYYHDKFVVTTTEYGKGSIDPGWRR
ncbi:MAG: type III pantothenate kinase [Candidatus Omnitrophota bacterium]